MSLTENTKFGLEKSEALPFKIFEPAESYRAFMSSDKSKMNLTVGSPVPSSSLNLDFGALSQQHQHLQSPSTGVEDWMGALNFDLTSIRGRPGSSPSELLLSTSSPISNLFSEDLFTFNEGPYPMSRSSGGDSNRDSNLPKRLHVSNIPFRFREHNLVMLFGKFGNVEEAEIIYNDKGSKGFGFVTMARGQDAEIALIRLNHSIVEGRIIEVNLATPKINGFKRSWLSVGEIPGVTIDQPGPSYSLASSQALIEAEKRLAEAKLKVLEIRKKIQVEKIRSTERVNF